MKDHGPQAATTNGIAIRRIPLTAVKPSALVDGSVLFEADLADEIDNVDG
jgi:hypothetical protein